MNLLCSQLSKNKLKIFLKRNCVLIRLEKESFEDTKFIKKSIYFIQFWVIFQYSVLLLKIFENLCF